MNTLPELAIHSEHLISRPHRLRLIETAGRQNEGITELFAALAMRGSFYAIAGGEWVPTYALVQSIRRMTPDVHKILGRVRLARPFTCYQVLDLLEDIRPEPHPILILDFLHHFYNPDIQPPVRRRVLQQSCIHLQNLALLRPVIVLIQQMHTEEYRQFFPMVAAAADEILRTDEPPEAEDPQLSFFQATAASHDSRGG
jgi:hypothetical protein